jgi:hypothetical protein
MFALISLALFAGNSDDRLPEVSLSFNAPKIVEMKKDTTEFKQVGAIKPLNLVSNFKVERTNPRYNPIYFGK